MLCFVLAALCVCLSVGAVCRGDASACACAQLCASCLSVCTSECLCFSLFFAFFWLLFLFFFSSFFGAGWRCCDVGCWCVFTYKCARFFFLLALRRVGFEVSDDGEVWKTVSVLPAPARQSGRSHLEWGASRPGDKKFSL